MSHIRVASLRLRSLSCSARREQVSIPTIIGSSFRPGSGQNPSRARRTLITRGLRGICHGVSPDNLQSYVDECVFRYDTRNDLQDPCSTLLNRAATGDA